MAHPIDVLVGMLSARRVGSQWRARCPAHDDASPSLSMRYGDRVPGVIICRAGCDTTSILRTLGLPDEFLSVDDVDAPAHTVNIVATPSAPTLELRRTRYEVRDPGGTLVATHVRRDLSDGSKQVYWERNGSSGLDGLPLDSLPLYRSETLNGGTLTYVVVTEGEKAADALADRMPATIGVVGTVTGASATPGLGPLEVLRDRDVLLWPDNDPAGESHMERIGRTLVGVAAHVSTLRVDGLPSSGDAADWHGDYYELMRLALEAAEREEPTPTVEIVPGTGGTIVGHRSVQDDGNTSPTEDAVPDGWPTLGEAALYGPIGDAVRAITPHTEADPAGILLSALTIAGVTFGRYRALSTPGAGVQAPSLFTVLVGDTSSGRKGTAVTVARDIIASGVGRDELDLITMPGIGSAEGLVMRLRDSVIQAAKTHAIAEHRVLIDEAEFARLLIAMSREGSTLSTVIRAAYDGTAVGRTVVAHSITIPWHHIGLIGQVTPAELRFRLSLNEWTSGFANRFLWVAVQGRWLDEPGFVRDHLTPDVVARLSDAFARTASPTFVPLELDRSASATWGGMYRWIRRDQRGRFGALANLTGREAPQLLRVASIFALADSDDHVRVDHLTAARAVVDYSIETVRYLWQFSTGDSTADALLDTLRKEGGELSWMELKDHGLRGSEAARVVSLLTDLRLVMVDVVPTGKRLRRVVRLV